MRQYKFSLREAKIQSCHLCFRYNAPKEGEETEELLADVLKGCDIHDAVADQLLRGSKNEDDINDAYNLIGHWLSKPIDENACPMFDEK